MNRPTIFRARYLAPISAPAIEDGALLVEGGRIAALGRFADLRGAVAELVDLGDAVILPPLVNAHTHLELTHFPRWAQQRGSTEAAPDFVGWIQELIRIKRPLPPESFLPSLRDGIAASLRAGTGAVGDILSWFPARQGYRESPLRGRLFLEVLGRDPRLYLRVLDSAAHILQEKLAGLLQLGLSPHSPYTLSAEFLESVLRRAQRLQVPLAMHFAESAEEVRFLDDSGGDFASRLYPFVGWGGMLPPPARRSPAAYLEDRGWPGSDWLLVHGVQVTEADLPFLRRCRSPVVLCPRSNARLGVGRAPVALYRSAGIPLALGTDSLASSDSLSVWDEMAFARNWFAEALQCGELLHMATLGGARALGLEGEMGALQPGWGAHFQVLLPPTLPALSELAEFCCSPGRTGEVSALYLDGRAVVANGDVTLYNPPFVVR